VLMSLKSWYANAASYIADETMPTGRVVMPKRSHDNGARLGYRPARISGNVLHAAFY
jgi:hypothetical protein